MKKWLCSTIFAFIFIWAGQAQGAETEIVPRLLEIVGPNGSPRNALANFRQNQRATCAVIDEDNPTNNLRSQLQLVQHWVDITVASAKLNNPNETYSRQICTSLRRNLSSRITNYVSSGAGVLIGDRYVLTVGHNIKYQPSMMDPATPAECKRQFVFDHTTARDPRPDQVYNCQRVVFQDRGADVALLELDRPVTDRAPARVRRTGQVTENTAAAKAAQPAAPLYALGFPLSSGNLTVAEGEARWAAPHVAYPNENPPRFLTLHHTAGTIPGFSGGGLFNSRDGLLEAVVFLGSGRILDYDRPGN